MEEYKSLKKGAFKKATQRFKEGRNKAPSDRLVKIISEVQPDEVAEKDRDVIKKKIAKDAEI
jgi:hypothetical protein